MDGKDDQKFRGSRESRCGPAVERRNAARHDDGFESRQYSKLSCKEQAVLEKLKGFLTGEDKKAIESILLHFGRKQGGQT